MLGGFEVVSQLSEGASAEVFLARPEDTQERVIVEVIRHELFRERDLTARFLDEAKIRRALQHPNVARRVIEATTRDGRPCLVSETLGESLAERLRTQGPLSVEAVIRLMLPICDALHFLHQRGLVHGNIKPASVYLGADGMLHRPKLVDFGLALFRPGRTLPKPPGRVLVEAEYLSPERIRGQRGTPLSDVYALGVLMYEALTGTPPFYGDAVDVRHRHLALPPGPLPPHCARIAPLIERCLQKEPQLRFPSALAVREALASHLEGTLPLAAPSSGLDPEVHPETGDVVGRYTLIEPIGEGAMGRVFLARHSRLGRIVALKLLKPEHAGNRDQVERFVREARAVNRIRNEHIVEIFDLVDEQVGQSGRRVYCVMELLRGSTLGELMLRGPVPLARGLRIMQQVASALDAAHHAGVVHRDIKPDNIFVTMKDGEDFAKVVDFGVAKLRELVEIDADGGEAPACLSQTAHGTVVGTPAYMAPEQVTGRPADQRTDVYAVGTVLYRMVAGQNPFAAAEFDDLARKIAREPPAPLPDVAPGGEQIPPGLRTLIRDCLQKEPGLRPHSMAEVAARLEKVIEHTPAQALPAPVLAPAKWKPWALRAAAAVAVVAIAIAGGYVWRAAEAGPQPAVVITHAVAAPPVADSVTLQLKSDPAGAEVWRMDTRAPLGTTPLTVTVPRAEGELSLRYGLAGHEPANVSVPTDANASVNVMLRPAKKRR